MRAYRTAMVCLLFLALGALATRASRASEPRMYQEDFSTGLFCDPLNTTANWDSLAGRIELHPFGMSIVGSYGSAFGGCIDIAGDHAYFTDGNNSLVVLDISDPLSPAYVGAYTSLSGPYYVKVAGDYAYVADPYSSSLVIIDISDPSAPTFAGSHYAGQFIRSLDVQGDHAYLAGDVGGFYVIDVSDPTAPMRDSRYFTTRAMHVAVSGDLAFLADYSGGFRSFDVSNPTAPALLDTYSTPANALSVALSGNFAMVACYNYGVLIIDISDPSDLTLIGEYTAPLPIGKVAIDGDFAYIAAGDSGIVVLDISDLSSPVLLEYLDTPGTANGVELAGEHAFIADGSSGVQVVDIADPVQPIHIGGTSGGTSSWDVAIAGDYAYLAHLTAGLDVIDISDPAAPVVVGNYQASFQSCRGVAVAGNNAFAAYGNAGFWAFDISDPAHPDSIGRCAMPGYCTRLAVSENYAYVSAGDSVIVVDISNPALPARAGGYLAPDDPEGMDISGDLLCVCVYYAGIQTVDISDPANPVVLATVNTPGAAMSVDICGDYAFVADGYGDLQIIDISDPATPSIIGAYRSFDVIDWAEGIAVLGDYAFVGDSYLWETHILHVFDVSDPTAPVLLFSDATEGDAVALALAGDILYLATKDKGMLSFQVFNRTLDIGNDLTVSKPVYDGDREISILRLESIQDETMTWEVSADSGLNWTGISHDGTWTDINYPGERLLWRATHTYSHLGVNPGCTDLKIEWLHEFAVIDSIIDVSNDQGGRVRISWSRSAYDSAGVATPVTDYSIFRKVEPLAAPQAPASGERALLYPPGDWDYIATIPADCEMKYSVLAPTLCDSTASGGIACSHYFIRSGTATPGVHYDSQPDSGWSVDNLSPHIPLGFMVACGGEGGTVLSWDECIDADFDHFRIYRGESADFVPSEANRVHTTVETAWEDCIDEGWKYFYKLTAVDASGNESPPASPEQITGDEPPVLPDAFALYQNSPNPFNPLTRIRFDLPSDSRINLAVYNIMGERIRVLVDGWIGAGRREAIWDGRDGRGKPVAAGIYFYRLTAPGFTESRKMVLIR